MSAQSKRPRGWIRVFGAPIVIAVLTLAGLLAALLFGETGRYLSWISVASPIIICAWAWWRVRVGDTNSNR
jgi:hypothetical protein